jgi:hypothetical protein
MTRSLRRPSDPDGCYLCCYAGTGYIDVQITAALRGLNALCAGWGWAGNYVVYLRPPDARGGFYIWDGENELGHLGNTYGQARQALHGLHEAAPD